MFKRIIAVIGAGLADESLRKTAEEIGRLLARRNAILICGGLGGVMEAASKGTSTSEGGTAVGILPQDHKNEANPYTENIPVATGFGEGRNIIIDRTANAIIAWRRIRDPF